MKVIVLCGGRGTRLGEETEIRPKPMVAIGGRPILWHIMKLFACRGFADFILPVGYKGVMIKEYFHNYYLNHCDLTVHLKSGDVEYRSKPLEDWTVTLVDTGLDAMTGGRIKLVERYLKDSERFMVTYGDGLADVDVSKVIEYHLSHGRMATVTAVRPPPRFGEVVADKGKVLNFSEKPQASAGWINGGFFVFERRFLDYLDGPETVLEGVPLERASADGQLMTYQHAGYWHCMDTPRDLDQLRTQWNDGQAKWKIWSDQGPAEISVARLNGV